MQGRNKLFGMLERNLLRSGPFFRSTLFPAPEQDQNYTSKNLLRSRGHINTFSLQSETKKTEKTVKNYADLNKKADGTFLKKQQRTRAHWKSWMLHRRFVESNNRACLYLPWRSREKCFVWSNHLFFHAKTACGLMIRSDV